MLNCKASHCLPHQFTYFMCSVRRKRTDREDGEYPYDETRMRHEHNITLNKGRVCERKGVIQLPMRSSQCNPLQDPYQAFGAFMMDEKLYIYLQ